MGLVAARTLPSEYSGKMRGMRETSSIRKKIVVNTVSMVMILSDCISLHFISDITHYDEFDFAGCDAATGADCFAGRRGNLHVLSDRVFMISDNRVFTEAGTTKAEKQALLEKAASGIEFLSLSLYTPDGKLYTSYGDGMPGYFPA